MWRFLKLLRLAFWRALEHDQFAVAKAAAYSAIITLFPAVAVVAAILAASNTTVAVVTEVSYALGRILPANTSEALRGYFEGNKTAQVSVLVPAFLGTLWTASGVMISWMDGFRRAYQMPKIWGMVKERLIAFLMVLLAGLPMTFASFLVAFGNQIETWMIFHSQRSLGPYILGMWTAVRWMISTVTSIAVIALIYHHGLPRTQPWHRVLPGSVLATVLWFSATIGFGWYISHYAHYDVVYGSVGTAIALLIWLYIISLVILVGAEFNAIRAPRFLFGAHSQLKVPVTRGEAR
jgi:membrane protein